MFGVRTHILGCGRSGTTALGEALAAHPSVRYLNEPRGIWRIDPRTDIWSDNERARLVLTDDDLSLFRALRLRAAFAKAGHGGWLVEKLPIDNFRVGYLVALDPDASFVHLVRNGLEVAASIARLADSGRWFVGRKWPLLTDHPRERGLADIVDLCTDNHLRGLLEWRLSVEAASIGMRRYAPDRSIEIRYEDLVQNPRRVLGEVLGFVGLPDVGLGDGIARRSPHVSRLPDMQESLIGGPMLSLCFEGPEVG